MMMPRLLKSAVRPRLCCTMLTGRELNERVWNLGQKTVGDTLEAWPGC